MVSPLGTAASPEVSEVPDAEGFPLYMMLPLCVEWGKTRGVEEGWVSGWVRGWVVLQATRATRIILLGGFAFP